MRSVQSVGESYRVVAYDCRFATPKLVSVPRAAGPSRVGKIEEADSRSMDNAVKYLEASGSFTLVKKDGVTPGDNPSPRW